jgi:hypothetical protein
MFIPFTVVRSDKCEHLSAWMGSAMLTVIPLTSAMTCTIMSWVTGLFRTWLYPETVLAK